MPRSTTAEFFIKTLTELRDAERATRTSWSRDRQKAQADHFAKTFWAGIDDSLRLSHWRLEGRLPREGNTRLSQSGQSDASRHASLEE